MLTARVCLCIKAGVLTTQSILDIASAVGTTSTGVLFLTLPYKGAPARFASVTDLLAFLQTQATTAVSKARGRAVTARSEE